MATPRLHEGIAAFQAKHARWTGYLALALLLGLVGGVAVGAAAATLAALHKHAGDVVTVTDGGPRLPAAEVALIAAGALAAAVLVALVPGRAAARTPAAALLRAE